MQTKNGLKVTKLTKLNDVYVGLVNGKLMSWTLDGRHANKNKSKYDLEISQPDVVRYVNVVMVNGVKTVSKFVFNTMEDAVKRKPKNYVKTIEI